MRWANAQNHLRYPQESVEGIRAALRRWGVCGTRRLLREYDLEVLAEAIADVAAAIEAGRETGEYVRNPAGLLVWALRAPIDNKGKAK